MMRFWLVGVVLSLVTSSAIGLAGAGERAARGCPDGFSIRSADEGSDVARGEGLAAVVKDTIVMIKDEGERQEYSHAGSPPVLLRHISSREGVGTAYVNDRAGGDVVVLVGSDGITEIPEGGEATHPALSPSGDLAWALDLGSLRVRSDADATISTIARPEGTVAIFSPVFTGPGEITAVVQEPVAGDPGHDDLLNNLYRYDLTTGSWIPLTEFTSDGELWSVIRTPIVDEDGSLLFVRLEGVRSATQPASFELWRLTDGGVSKVSDLPGEMFLAGVSEGRLYWNVDARDGGQWRVAEDRGSRLEDRGCGSVSVDPRSELDPDLIGGEGFEPAGDSSPAGSSPAARHSQETPQAAHLGVKLGDFSSRREAEAIASLVGLDPSTGVVNHEVAPGSVSPGFWALVWRVADGADPQTELARLRAAFPQYAERMWITVL